MRPEKVVWCVEPQIRHVRRIQARVALRLVREQAGLHARLRERTPYFMEGFVVRPDFVALLRARTCTLLLQHAQLFRQRCL